MHRTSKRLAASAIGVLLTAAGCSNASTAPTPQDPAPGNQTQTISGIAIDGLSAAGLGDVLVALEGAGTTTTGADGGFSFQVTGTQIARRGVTLTSPQTVERVTDVVAGPAPARVSLIPSSFNLPAYDEMLRQRDGRLLRWINAPGIVVERRELRFTDTVVQAYTAESASGTMSDTDVNQLLADLSWGLPPMTGGTFTSFASTSVQTGADAEQVQMKRDGLITVARYVGLQGETNFIAYGRWWWNANGQIYAGMIMLDADIDVSRQYATRRRAIRTHELGHALGYDHVTAASSVMAPIALLEPQRFDVDATALAFQRPTGNVSPDRDPSPLGPLAAQRDGSAGAP